MFLAIKNTPKLFLVLQKDTENEGYCKVVFGIHGGGWE
jgi:hypothetical protein